MFDRINNFQHFAENTSDWGVLANAMSSPLKMPSDLDGYYEIKGNTLLLEEKLHGVTVPTGQQIAINNWHQAPDKIVMVLWYEKTYVIGDNGKPLIGKHGLDEFTRDYSKMAIYVPGLATYSRMISTPDKIRRFVGNWEIWAMANPYLTKQQMINRVTNGLTQKDIDKLFAGVADIKMEEIK